MDEFFERFRRLGSTVRADDPLARITSAWDALLAAAKNEAVWKAPVANCAIPRCLRTILDALVAEHAAGPCSEFFLNNDMLSLLVALAENDLPHGFRNQVVAFATDLVSVLDPSILFSNAIQRPIVRIMALCETSKDAELNAAVVRLEASLSAIIAAQPELLVLFFDASQKDPNQKLSFPLLDHATEYVSASGDVGELARSVCEQIMRLANPDDSLEAYILSNEYPLCLVAASVGLFVQLPTIDPDLNLSQFQSAAQLARAREEASADHTAFTNSIECIQRIIANTKSTEITHALLSHLDTLFFKSSLPNTLASASDFDGSALTILSLLIDLARKISHPLIIDSFVHALLGNNDDDDEQDKQPQHAIKTKKDMNDSQKQLASADAEKQDANTQSPPKQHLRSDLSLSMRDIIISKLNSLSEDVQIRTLGLLQSLFRNHTLTAFPLAFEHLPNNHVDSLETKSAAIGADGTPLDHESSMQSKLQLVERYFALLPNDSFKSSTLESYMSDAKANLARINANFAQHMASELERLSTLLDPESNRHQVSAKRSDLDSTAGMTGSKLKQNKDIVIEPLRPMSPETFQSKVDQLRMDPTLMKLMNKLRNFFSQSVRVNVELTGVLQQLVLAPYPVLYQCVVEGKGGSCDQQSEEDREQNADDDNLAPSTQKYTSAHVPTFEQVLVRLSREISDRRASIPNFDLRLTLVKQSLFDRSELAHDESRSQTKSATESVSGMVGTSVSSKASSRAHGADAEFLRNVVVFEESVKELLASILVRSDLDGIASVQMMHVEH